MNKKEEWQRLGHILYYQALSDMKQEIDRKYLGVVWWFLDPMLYMGVFYVLFASGLRGGSSGSEFVWFLLCGLVPWKWFAGSLETCSRSITSNASLISQVYFPKIILPATAFVAQSFKFLIVLFVLMLALLLSGRLPVDNLPLLLGLILLQGALNFSIGAFSAALIPFVPDLKQLISYSVMLMFFLSGIFYNLGNLSPEVMLWLQYNPMLTIIAAYRHLLLDAPAPEQSLLNIVYLEVTLLFLLSLFMYYRYDRIFPRLLV